jgi:hypothetical protein
MNQKIEVVTAILKDNARQFRVTNRKELAREAGRRLHRQGLNYSDAQLSEDTTYEVLGRVAERSDETKGVLLPALVVHFRDSQPSGHFYDWANKAGIEANHGDAVRAVFNAYGDPVIKDLFYPVLTTSLDDEAGEDSSSRYDDFAPDYDDEDDTDPDDVDQGD